ncbi:MAG: helix-turn-helix transcriptional regulator [Clostridia bacterium]|nr:helix-turn-helix transcriptional regulator [Clostridia bacterium]
MIRLFELRNEKGLSQRAVAQEMFISQGTYNNWENEKTQPSIEQLKRLSALFGVSVDYLIGNTDEYGTVGVKNNLSPDETALIGKYRALSKESQGAILTVIENLK